MISIKSILNEGMYDKITGIVIKDIFRELKAAYSTTGPKYRGMVLRPTEPIKNFELYFVVQDRYSDVGEYSDSTSGLDFEVRSAFVFSPSVKKGKPYVEGFAQSDEDEALLTANIAINPEDGTSTFSKIQASLRDTIRHELEHFTQKGLNVKPGKRRNSNTLKRMQISNDKSRHYQYYMLPDEVEPQLQGLYSKAKTLKQPFQKVVEDFLDELQSDGTIDEKGRKSIYNKWKKWAPKIGGIPPLK